MVSLTQSTELGTVYSLAELRDLSDHAHALGLAVHMDGARLCNAAASLGCSLRALTTDVGVDVLSLGGTKNGLMMGEAVVVLNPDRLTHPGEVSPVEFLRKSSMQLASKMRYVSAQLIAMLEGDLWLRNAQHANAMAARLAEHMANEDGVHITQPVEANAIFAQLPAEAIAPLQELFSFYVWDASTHVVRWMCSWDTTPEDVDAFARAVHAELSGS